MTLFMRHLKSIWPQCLMMKVPIFETVKKSTRLILY